MHWRDNGMVLSARRHGEASVILDVLTVEHGRHAGIVRGGTSRQMRPVLQPGADVAVEWSARLETHLGAYRVEGLPSRLADILAARDRLEVINAMTAILSFALPEREPVPSVVAASLALRDRVADGAPWQAAYVRWEMALLADLGFGLALDQCAATGGTEDLIYVSPRTGRAVSRAGAGPWADKLLPLPAFLIDGEVDPDRDAVLAGLRLTGHFLLHHLAASIHKDALPAARERLISLCARNGVGRDG